MRAQPGSAVRLSTLAARGCLVLALAGALALAAAAQSQSTPIQLSLPPAAVLAVSGSGVAGASGQPVVAVPGGSSVLTLSYRASQGGGAALTVAAQPVGLGADGIVVVVQGSAPAQGGFVARHSLVAPHSGPVLLWRGGPGAHGLGQRLAVRYAAPPGGAGGPVMLVYTLAVS